MCLYACYGSPLGKPWKLFSGTCNIKGFGFFFQIVIYWKKAKHHLENVKEVVK